MQNSNLKKNNIYKKFSKKTSNTFNFGLLTLNFCRRQTGQILVIVFVAMGVVLFTVLSIIAGAQVYFQNAQYSVDAEKAVALTEAGVDKAVASLNKSGGTYNGETETFLGNGSYAVTIEDKNSSTKQITATGYIPSKASPKVKRTVKIDITRGLGISFNYGLQVGQGGLTMGNGAILNGSIYSNGNISSGNTLTITGDVYVAGGTQPAADQETDCSGSNCQDYVFGKNVSGEARQDVAQSFRPSASGVINKVSLKLKKTGSPTNPAVRVMRDSSGKPDKNGVLASGTLSANLISGSYNFIDVTFSSAPNLTADTTYWIMIHANSLDNSNYWYWLNDIAQSYTRGQPKWSSNWQAGNPAWNTITPGDFGFKAYMGGVTTSISGGSGSSVSGNVHANTISGLTINGDAYYQTISNSTVNGTSYLGSSDSPPTVFPVSEANISDWKTEAEQAGVITGDIAHGNSCTATLGPRKITGSVSFGNGCTVTVKTPIWIQGALSAGNNTIFNLDSSYGSASGVIVVDGSSSFGNDNDFRGSGTAGSYLMLISTASGSASSFGNGSISGIVYAPNGTVNLSNGARFKEIVAYGLILGNSAQLSYDTGMANAFFSSGPAGSYDLVKGTYQVK